MAMNLAMSALMAALTTGVHFIGIAALLRLSHRMEALQLNRIARRMTQWLALLAIVFALFLLHLVEIAIYAGAFIAVEAFDTWEEALYFSASSFTTVGYGDVVLDSRWRLFGALESANGLLLIGWSTAFLIGVTNRVSALEMTGERRRAD